MSTEEQQILIAGYVLGDLSPDEAAVVAQMMAANPAVVQDIEQMQQALDLSYPLTEVQPPSRLRAAILNAHQTGKPPVSASSTPSLRPVLDVGRPSRSTPARVGAPRSSSRRRGLKGLGSIAALLILGLGIGNYTLWRSLRTLQAERQATTFQTVSLTSAADTAPDGAVTVELDSANLQALLETELPPLPEGQVYVLWTVLQPEAPFTKDEKGAILTHVFTGGDEDQSIPLPPVYRDSRWIKAIAVTVEDANAPQRHSASPILIETL